MRRGTMMIKPLTNVNTLRSTANTISATSTTSGHEAQSLRHPPATDCLPTASSSPVPAEQRGGRAHEAPVADASVANGCMQGCAFSFLFFAVMSVVASAFEAAGVPCAGPLAAGVAGGHPNARAVRGHAIPFSPK